MSPAPFLAFTGLALGLWALFYTSGWLVGLVQRASPRLVFLVKTTRPQVALTLDDGPDDTVTPQVLEVLRREEVPATWFIIGQRAERHSEWLHAIRDQGHDLANHLWTDAPTWLMSLHQFRIDMARTEALVRQEGAPRLLRPASGWIRPAQLQEALVQGYRVVLGSAYCSDWMKPPDPYIRWAMTRMCRPGAILILHVGLGRSHTPRVLPEIISRARARGFTFVPLRALLS